VLKANALPKQRILKRRSVHARARCDEDCLVFASGSIRIGTRNYPFDQAAAEADADATVRLELGLSGKARPALRSALRRGRHPRADIDIWAQDGLGNATELGRVSVRARR
jgi:hypothetical protein